MTIQEHISKTHPQNRKNLKSSKKEMPGRKSFSFFHLEKLKNSILNETFNLEMATITALFPRIRVLSSFSNFPERPEETCFPLNTRL